jgi:hypothetical protein
MGYTKYTPTYKITVSSYVDAMHFGILYRCFGGSRYLCLLGERVSSSEELNFHGSNTVVVRMAIKRCDVVYTGRISSTFHRNALAQVHLMMVSAIVHSSILKMEAVLSYETSANY